MGGVGLGVEEWGGCRGSGLGVRGGKSAGRSDEEGRKQKELHLKSTKSKKLTAALSKKLNSGLAQTKKHISGGKEKSL